MTAVHRVRVRLFSGLAEVVLPVLRVLKHVCARGFTGVLPHPIENGYTPILTNNAFVRVAFSISSGYRVVNFLTQKPRKLVFQIMRLFLYYQQKYSRVMRLGRINASHDRKLSTVW